MGRTNYVYALVQCYTRVVQTSRKVTHTRTTLKVADFDVYTDYLFSMS